MATTPVEFDSPTGLTLTLKLYPHGSDTIANGSGDSATEATNRNGLYSSDVTEALTGLHHAIIEDASGNLIASWHVELADTTAIHRCGDLPVLTGLFDPAADTVANVTTVATLTGHTAQTADHAAAITTIDGIVDAILVDTGTTLPASIATAQADLDIITGASGVNLLTATQASIDAIEADTNELQTNQGNWLTATGFSTHTAANVRTEMDSNSTQLAAIVADTNELQGDWTNGGRLDLILDARASQSSVDTIDGIVDSILIDTATSLPAQITALNNISAADVNAEVVDVLTVDNLVAGVTVTESLRRIGARAHKLSGAGSGTETVTDWAESANTIVYTVDNEGNISGVIYN
jgi:hypothetical protein